MQPSVADWGVGRGEHLAPPPPQESSMRIKKMTALQKLHLLKCWLPGGGMSLLPPPPSVSSLENEDNTIFQESDHSTIHCLQKLSNRRPRSPQLCSTPHPSTPHPILTTYPPHTPPSPSPPKMWVAWEASSNWREGPNLPWLENLSHLQQTFSSSLKYELTSEQSSIRK